MNKFRVTASTGGAFPVGVQIGPSTRSLLGATNIAIHSALQEGLTLTIADPTGLAVRRVRPAAVVGYEIEELV